MPKKTPKSRALPKVAYSDSGSEYDDDIDTYYKQKDKILLDNTQDVSEDTEEEEVYRLEDSESDSDEEIAQMQQQLRQLKRNKTKKKLGSDLEDDTEDEALPDSRAWGSKKSWFMGGDVRDNKIILSGDDFDAGAAALEEKAMLEIEKRHLARMTEEDYMPVLPKKREEKKPKKGKKKKAADSENGIDVLERIQIQTDLSKLSEEQEFARMKDMHPEYVVLVNDFRVKMGEFRERVIPLMSLVKQGKIDGLGATYLRMKYHIISNYLICGGFYMYYMSKKTPNLHYHPVMKRLQEFQQFYNQLVPLDNRLKADLDTLLERLEQGRKVGKVTCEVPEAGSKTKKTKKALKRKAEEGPAAKKQKVEISQEDDLEEKSEDKINERQMGDAEEAEGDEDGELERRPITYQMEKNKGLTAHKKKELKNPRVKHRTKYRRALIRRKGQVRDFKQHKTVYAGEMTGIRAGIIRSRKLH